MLDVLIQNNYKQIKTVARNICNTKRGYKCDDLINEAYLIARRKEVPTDNLEFVKYYSRIMKLLFIGNRSAFNKIYSGVEVEIPEHYQPTDNDALNEIYMACEGTNEASKELIEELSHLTKEKVNKYIDLLEFKSTLSPWDKEIFEQHFEHGMSSRDIATGLEVLCGYETNYQRINILINELKERLETWKLSIL